MDRTETENGGVSFIHVCEGTGEQKKPAIIRSAIISGVPRSVLSAFFLADGATRFISRVSFRTCAIVPLVLPHDSERLRYTRYSRDMSEGTGRKSSADIQLELRMERETCGHPLCIPISILPSSPTFVLLYIGN